MNNLRKIKDYYDEFWLDKNKHLQEKSNLRDYEDEARTYAMDSIIKNFGSLKDKKILEIGPGKGYDVINFAKLGAKVTAIDISNNSLNLTKKLALKQGLGRKVNVINMDAHKLKFKENQFDVVFILSTLMHLDHLKVAEECRRVIKKDGIFVSIEPINNNPLIKIYRTLFSEFKDTKPKYLTYNDLRIISKKFRRSKIKTFYLFSFLILTFKEYSLIYNLLVNLLKRSENLILKIFPSLEKKCWLSVSINMK